MQKASVWKIAMALFIGCVYIYLFGIVQVVKVEENHQFSVSVDIPEVTTPETPPVSSSTTIKLQNMQKPGFEDYVPETTLATTTPPETTTVDNVIRPPENETEAGETPPPETTTPTPETTTPPETVATPAPEWEETPVSGERYVTESCYSRKKALLGAESVTAYNKDDKVTVVAKTDTGYYKLEDGTFIHEDYLTEKAETSETTPTTPAPEWEETPVSGERYVTESCYSRKKALIGAESVAAYNKDDKVVVVAKTDTGYYKLEDGSFIHEDYLTESVASSTPAPETTPPPSGDGGGDDATEGQVYVFNADTEEYFSCTMNELLAMATDDTLIGYDQYKRVVVENGKFVLYSTSDFNNPDFDYLYVVGSAREIVIEAVVAEISDWYEAEAIKAQAICDYTYLRKKNIYGDIPPIHLVSYDYNRSRVEKCVDAVLGLALYYGDEMIQSTFTAATPGYTNSSYDVWGVHYPYLVSVDSSWEMKYNTFKKVGNSFSSSYIKQRVSDVLGITLKGSPDKWFSVKETLESTEYGWVTSISVGGKTTYGDNYKITGRVIREQVLDFAIDSPAFTVSYDESTDEFIFYIYGSGHGVGFSQFGAHIAAQDMGWKYDKILAHYFPGTEIR